MTAPDIIRAAVSAALSANETRCLDEEADFLEVLDEVTREVVQVIDAQLDGTCTVCGRTDLVDLTHVGDHPEPLRSWVIEQCSCGASRIAEHELPEGVERPEAEDVRVIAATPWRSS